MTDQDNLRDRIAAIVEAHLPREHMGYGSGEYAANAIIDHFGLTTETHAATHAKRTMTRITSNWEWNN